MSTSTDIIELRQLSPQGLPSSDIRELQADNHLGPSRNNFDFSLRKDQMNGQSLEQQLFPADHGAAAWRFLFGAFMIEALQWGWSFIAQIHQCNLNADSDIRICS